MSKQNNESLEVLQAKLASYIEWFEGDEFRLDEAQQKYDEAAKVIEKIEERVKTHEHHITVLKAKFDSAA